MTFEGYDNEEDTTVQVTDQQLRNIAALAKRQVELERAQLAQQAVLDGITKDLRKVCQLDLPQAMQEAGLESFTTVDGHTIGIKETLYASIAKKNKEAAVKWLLENDLGSLVREDVTVNFEKGQHEDLERLSVILQENGFDRYYVDESVNTGSVKSAIKELLAEGKDVPLALFGAHFVKQSVIS